MLHITSKSRKIISRKYSYLLFGYVKPNNIKSLYLIIDNSWWKQRQAEKVWKNIKAKFNSDDDLLLGDTLKLYDTILVFRSVFHDGKKYFQQVFFR